MTFEEFKEINRKYGLPRMWIDEFENIAKEEYEKLGIEVLQGYE